MIQIMIYSLTAITSMVFMQMNHPLAMGLILLVQTALICFITGIMAKSFWFSYILFLIFLGGMLVLFIYVTSLASNEMFSLSMTMMMMYMISLTLMMTFNWLMDKTLIYPQFMNNEMSSLNYSHFMMEENSMELSKLYSFPTNYITIMLINYLLICLVSIVKITNIFYGPLRPLNK